jgi:hypothetical protein
VPSLFCLFRRVDKSILETNDFSSATPVNSDVVYVAVPGHEWTRNEERGVFKTTDGGKSYQVLGQNLPSCFVWDLKIHFRDNILVIATNGRGIWVVDNLNTVQNKVN